MSVPISSLPFGQLSSIALGGLAAVTQILADGKPADFTFRENVLRFPLTTIKKSLTIV